MKKIMIAAFALTMFGGAAFAQNAKTTPAKKVETKEVKEVKTVKADNGKHPMKMKTTKTAKVVATPAKAEKEAK